MKTKHQNQRGFTVLESIVAIAILSLSISGVFSAVQQSFSQSIIARDEIKAFYLAQEAIEIIKNKRDSNQIDRIKGGTNGWLYEITTACPAGRTCTVDARNLNIFDCGDGGWGSCAQNLKQDPDTFLYSYISGNVTNFKREIQIESVNADEIAITVRILWTKGSLITREFKVKTHLFNWI